jgi:tetratricopeptide (TPR) repeat protein
MSIQAWLAEGLKLYQSGDPARALDAWYRVLEVDPANEVALQYIVTVRKQYRLDSVGSGTSTPMAPAAPAAAPAAPKAPTSAMPGPPAPHSLLRPSSSDAPPKQQIAIPSATPARIDDEWVPHSEDQPKTAVVEVAAVLREASRAPEQAPPSTSNEPLSSVGPVGAGGGGAFWMSALQTTKAKHQTGPIVMKPSDMPEWKQPASSMSGSETLKAAAAPGPPSSMSSSLSGSATDIAPVRRPESKGEPRIETTIVQSRGPRPAEPPRKPERTADTSSAIDNAIERAFSSAPIEERTSSTAMKMRYEEPQPQPYRFVERPRPEGSSSGISAAATFKGGNAEQSITSAWSLATVKQVVLVPSSGDGPAEHPSPWDDVEGPAVAVDLDRKSTTARSMFESILANAAGKGTSDMGTVRQPTSESAPDDDDGGESETLMSAARELFELGDFSGSLELVEKVLKTDPHHEGALAYLARNSETLQKMYASKIGALDRAPRQLVPPDEVIWINMHHRAGFLLAQVDGQLTYEDLLAVSGMPRFDTIRILADLVQNGIIG